MAFRKNAIVLCLLLSLVMTFVVTIKAASTGYFTNCKVYNIHGGGGAGYDLSHPNKKQTSNKQARFTAEYISASLGLNGQICTKGKSDRSYQVSLQKDRTVYVTEYNSCVSNTNYYAKGVSKGMEWASSSGWIGVFSSDGNY